MYDLRRLVATLNDEAVDYLLVGGAAVRLHGATRRTQDVDILVRRSRPNLERLARALDQLGARIRAEGLDDEVARSLTPSWDAERLLTMQIATLQTDAGPLDVLSDMPDGRGRRVGYEDLVSRSVDAVIAPGLVVAVAGLGDIIASKEWADRPKDHEALPELRRLAQVHRRR